MRPGLLTLPTYDNDLAMHNELLYQEILIPRGLMIIGSYATGGSNLASNGTYVHPHEAS